jgi:L-fuculose-phosphate aldolase
MTLADARRVLVEGGRRLLAEGLVARSWGNLSLRLDAGTMAVTPSGIPWNELTEAMISVVDLETGDWTGDWKPSGERKVHREIYRRRPEVNAVVHTHQNAASVCAVARIAVPLGTAFVPCAPYGLPGTKALTRGTVDALGQGGAVLMANHGVFTVGKDLDEAFDRIRDLEKACGDLVASRASALLPGRADAPWDPSWLTVVPRVTSDAPVWRSVAPFTVAWSALGRPLPALLDDLAQLAGARVEVVAEVPEKRPQADVLLIRDRGALVWGQDAEALALVVEKAARAALGAPGLGGARAFPAWEAGLMRWVYKNAYAKQAGVKSGEKPA